ncbi:MAG TPA: hypothetical protein PKA00_01145 [Saprospiraceae bacterium]|nr:hypothetical protein [Saprospiraceae bacterium]HMQ81473.1 hypothetical protein [Saprospiraceae bacterium]
MSKKKFTVGLESVFSEATHDTLHEDSPLLQQTLQKSGSDIKNDESGKRTGSKNFSSELEIFLKEAFEESFERQTANKALETERETPLRKKRQKPPSGLDVLIRSTIEPTAMEISDKAKNTKRIVLAFDSDKFQKLKHIARVERTYLRNIIDEMVAEFIEKYEKDKPLED